MVAGTTRRVLCQTCRHLLESVLTSKNVYDVNAGRSGFDVFVKTTRKIGEYVGGKLKDASKFWNAMDPENLGFEVLMPPDALSDDANIMQVEVWKVAYKDYNNAIKIGRAHV